MCREPHTFSRNRARPAELAKTTGNAPEEPNDSRDAGVKSAWLAASPHPVVIFSP